MSVIELLRELQSGEWISGSELGGKLGVTRMAVNKQIQEASRYGVEIHSLKGKGYRLSTPVSLLNPRQILQDLTETTLKKISQLEIFSELKSTNDRVQQKHEQDEGHGYVCLAESQTKGKGRLGREWYSPFAENIYLSIGWKTTKNVAALGGLSLVVGCYAISTLQKLGFSNAALKWPNDIFLGGKKAGGILIELVGDIHGPCKVVVGVGLNVNMLNEEGAIETPWASLRQLLIDRSVSMGPESIADQSFQQLSVSGWATENYLICRNHVAKLLISDIIEGIECFFEKGLAYFCPIWQRYDHLYGKPVQFYSLHKNFEGIGRGVSINGDYMVDVAGEIVQITSGEVSSQQV